MSLNQKIKINDNADMDGQYFIILKLTNKFMQHGKKTIMENIFIHIRITIKTSWRYFPKEALNWLFDTIKPLLSLSTTRQGKMTNFIPYPLQNKRPIVVSLKWFIQNVKVKSIPKRLADRITIEIAYIFFNSRYSLTQRRNTYYEVIYDNRSNMRYRWK